MKKEDIESFLHKHSIFAFDDYTGYHYAYALYVLYLIAAMALAEDVEDGMCFDEVEAAVLLKNLSEAEKVLIFFREKMNMAFGGFDIAEKITLKGCRLEKGKIIGDTKEAAQIARMWIHDYSDEKINLFVYEVGIYILFLLQREIDYSDFIRRKM